MDIFELVSNEKFFNPLSGKNRRIYFECILQLIEKSKEVPILYDSDARSCIALYLKNCEYVFQSENEFSDADLQVPERSASVIMGYLRDCGWVTPRDIGRNGENVANVSAPCRRIIEFLKKMCEKGTEGALSNHIFSMYEILKSAFEEGAARAERPYTNILKPLMDNVTELKNELFDLKDNIASIMRIVMEFQDANSVGRFLMKDELLDKFFNDYFFIKNNGLIPSQLSFIKNKLRIITQGELREKMITECAAQMQLETEHARERVEANLSELQYFLTVEYEENMELIDARINTYYNLANTRIMLVMGNGINMESVLDSFLSKIKTMADEEKIAALKKVTACMQVCSQKYISTRSYEKRKRRDRDDSAIGLMISDISEEEKERKTQEMIQNTRNRFSIDNTKQFLDACMTMNTKMELKEQNVTTREDALMFAAALMYSGIEEFPYEVELKEDFAETKIARISNMKIQKKEERHGGI